MRQDIFARYDMDGDELLDFAEMGHLLQDCGRGHTLTTREDFQRTVLAQYCSTSSGLSTRGLIEYFTAAVRSEGEASVWQALHALGYDNSFYALNHRVFNVSVHSDTAHELQRRSCDAQFTQQAMLALTLQYGKVTDASGLKLYVYNPR